MSHKVLFCRVRCAKGESTWFIPYSSEYAPIPKIVAATTIMASPIPRRSACPSLPVTKSDTTRRQRPPMEIATPWRIQSIQSTAKRSKPRPTNTCVQWYFVLIYIQLENRHTGIAHLQRKLAPKHNHRQPSHASSNIHDKRSE